MPRWLLWLVPGLAQFARGRTGLGATLLAAWLLNLLVGLWRWERLSAVWHGPAGDRISVVALALLLLGCWLGSGWEDRRARRRVRHGGTGRPWAGWPAFRESRAPVAALAVLLLFYWAALMAPLLAPYDPAFQPAFQAAGDLASRLAAPSAQHPLGTDQLSRDVLSRILYGARISLSIGLLAVWVSVGLGTLLGATAGFVGKWTDAVVVRLVDMVMAFPRIVLLIAVVALFGRSLVLVVLALALTQWPATARLVRGEILALKEREFAVAARSLGLGGGRILFRHLLPNAMAPVLVAAALAVGNTIILEAGLSFLGLGVQPPTPSWGSMVADGRAHLLDAWWIATFPGLAIVIAVVGFNLLSDGIRDALDPRQLGGRSRG